MFADRIPSRSRCRAPQSSTSLLPEQLRRTCTRGHHRRRNRGLRQGWASQETPFRYDHRTNEDKAQFQKRCGCVDAEPVRNLTPRANRRINLIAKPCRECYVRVSYECLLICTFVGKRTFVTLCAARGPGRVWSQSACVTPSSITSSAHERHCPKSNVPTIRTETRRDSA